MRLGETHHFDCRAAQFSMEPRGGCVLLGRGRQKMGPAGEKTKLLAPSSSWCEIIEYTQYIFNAKEVTL